LASSTPNQPGPVLLDAGGCFGGACGPVASDADEGGDAATELGVGVPAGLVAAGAALLQPLSQSASTVHAPRAQCVQRVDAGDSGRRAGDGMIESAIDAGWAVPTTARGTMPACQTLLSSRSVVRADRS
jgi:hypothetical protein